MRSLIQQRSCMNTGVQAKCMTIKEYRQFEHIVQHFTIQRVHRQAESDDTD